MAHHGNVHRQIRDEQGILVARTEYDEQYDNNPEIEANYIYQLTRSPYGDVYEFEQDDEEDYALTQADFQSPL